MSETQEASTKAAKKEVVYEAVTMTDGRVVQFPGNRQVDKEVTPDTDAGAVTVRFDFRNGETRSVSSSALTPGLLLQAAGHGISQKVGDSWASLKDPDDMVLKCDEMLDRLAKDEWFTVSEAGDSMAGASIIIRALVEHTGKTVEQIKGFLQKKLDTAKLKGEKLSRQELYAGFRRADTPTGKIIKRLEEEKLNKSSSKVNAADLLAELDAE